MKVLVCGARGCVGAAVTRALRSRGHRVVEGARGANGPSGLALDFMVPVSPADWADRLRGQSIEAVVNCVGILVPGRGQTFERVHTAGPSELFRGAALAGARRVVQVSALGVGTDPDSLATPYLHSKLLAEETLAALPLDGVVVRPSLVYGPGSHGAALFATLAALPIMSLPGGGGQRLQPVHVVELAEAIVRLVEQEEPTRGVLELGGGEVLTYRDMLGHYRHALGLGAAAWVPVPMPLMSLGAWFAEALPQRVLSRDTVRLLARGSVPARNALPDLLGRTPSGFAHGLAITPPVPLVDLRVTLSPAVDRLLRATLAAMWWVGAIAMASTVPLAAFAHLLLGLAVLWRPAPWVLALQAVAVAAHAALALPDSAPAAAGLPALAAIAVLWLGHHPPPPARSLDKPHRSANT